MGMIINIDEALKLRTDYNVLREPLNDMLKNEQEAWERKNPIDLLFARKTIDRFQETYTSSIGFAHAFSETNDYAVGPIFNTAEGFSATFRTRTFQGGFIITKQVLEDGQVGHIKDTASAFIKRWHGDQVEYAMTAIDSGFGVERTFEVEGKASKLQLFSADTVDGKIGEGHVKAPLFYKAHSTIDRGDGTAVGKQSNFYFADVNVLGSDPGKIAKLADIINYVITEMENYRDDNNKRAGLLGPKTIVAPNDARLKAAIETALGQEMFRVGESDFVNNAYKRATLETTPYLFDTVCCGKQADGKVRGFFIVDKGYMNENHGLEFTQRIPLTLDVFEKREAPQGIKYEGRERFDINVASWRGIAYVYIGTPSTTAGDWNYFDVTNYDNANNKMTGIKTIETIVKPVSVVGTVTTEQA